MFVWNGKTEQEKQQKYTYILYTRSHLNLLARVLNNYTVLQVSNLLVTV